MNVYYKNFKICNLQMFQFFNPSSTKKSLKLQTHVHARAHTYSLTAQTEHSARVFTLMKREAECSLSRVYTMSKEAPLISDARELNELDRPAYLTCTTVTIFLYE